MGRDSALLAVVVGAVDYGEADRIVRLFSAEQGRSAVIARGARSARSRHAALDIGALVRVQLRQGRGPLPYVTGVDAVHLPRRARTDLARLALLAYGCEVCAGLSPEHHETPRLFGLLEAWLRLLEGEGTPGPACRVALEAKALTFAGLTPALIMCARCGEALDDPAVFDPEAGGGLHARCGGGRSVPVGLLRTFEALRRSPMADAVGYDLPREGAWLLSDFVQYQLGRGLKSRGLLEGL